MKPYEEKMLTKDIQRLSAVLGSENAKRLSQAYFLADEDTRERILELIDVVKAGVSMDPDLASGLLYEPPSQERAAVGDIFLGTVLYGQKPLYPVNIPHETLLMHMGIFGSSGYGKTNISYSLVKQISDAGYPVVIFDFSKRNYKDLLATELKDRITLYTVGRDVAPFFFNPVKPPPGVQLSQWMKEFATIFDHSYWLLGGGRHIILKALDGVHTNKKQPRIADLRKWLTEFKDATGSSRERNWLSTAERPLDSLTFKEVGIVFDTDEGILPSSFFKPGQVTILELDALDPSDKTFVIEIILQWLRDWLLIQKDRETLKGVLILEEAHHILSREKSRKLGTETVMDLVFREIRELGLGVIYLDQHPSLVSYPAIGNTSTHVYMNLGLDTKQSSDVQDAISMLGLDYEDDASALRRIPVGQGFVLFRRGGFNQPFMARFPHVKVPKGSVTDAEIRNLMKEKGILQRIEEQQDEAPAPQTGVAGLDDVQQDIFQVITTGKGIFSSQIYKQLKLSGSTFDDKVKKLMDIGLVAFRKAKIGKNRLHIHFPTATGITVYEETVAPLPTGTKEINVSSIKHMMAGAGWSYVAETNSFDFDDGDKKLTIKIAHNLDRAELRKILQETSYVLYTSERIRHVLLQVAAELVYETGNQITLHIADVREFADTRKFQEVTFD
ncbi:MAG: DUF87 domain-containing protein [Nanoarchaeota archaeon]|nr:DUF87 domain-containing protein [Nanoarchaeota archaeon]